MFIGSRMFIKSMFFLQHYHQQQHQQQQQHQMHCLKSSVIDLNHRHSPMQTTNTSNKQTHFSQTQHVRYEDDPTTNLASFSNSEPHLSDQFVHDINCAKNKNSYLNRTVSNGISDI